MSDAGEGPRFGRAALQHHAGLLVAGGLALGFVASFVALSEELREGDLATVDGRVLAAFDAVRSTALTGVALNVTALGSIVVLALVTTLLALAFWRLERPRTALLMIAVSLGASAWTTLLKHVFERHRPTAVVALQTASGYSFPSGHSLASAAIYGTAAILLAVHTPRTADRALIAACTAFLLVAIGASRVYLGVHYPSDVLAGYCAGFAWALWLLGVASWLQRRRRALPRRADA